MTENHVSSSAAQALQGEWHTLQNNHERYEAYAVAIKLLALVFAVVGLVVGLNPFKLSGVLAVLWLQEGILRTSQARLAARLTRIEALLRETIATLKIASACQLYTDWAATRGSSIGLIGEYLRNALRPTVAYPYVLLILIAAATCF